MPSVKGAGEDFCGTKKTAENRNRAGRHFFGEAEKKPSVEGAGEDFCGTKNRSKYGD